MLWLELQAWHGGQTIEEKDEHLEKNRYDISAIIQEIIEFKYTSSKQVLFSWLSTVFGRQVH